MLCKCAFICYMTINSAYHRTDVGLTVNHLPPEYRDKNGFVLNHCLLRWNVKICWKIYSSIELQSRWYKNVLPDPLKGVFQFFTHMFAGLLLNCCPVEKAKPEYVVPRSIATIIRSTIVSIAFLIGCTLYYACIFYTKHLVCYMLRIRLI